MISRLLKAAGALLCSIGLAVSASSQMTTITATNISMGGVPIATGTVTFTPTNSLGTAIAFSSGGGGLNSPGAFPCTITAGAITGTCQVPDATLTTPANILYSVQVTNTATHAAFILQAVPGISGATWALDHYGPPAATSNIQPIQVSYGTAAPPSTCNAPSFYVRAFSGGELYMCVASAEVLVTGGGSGTVSASAMQAAVSGLTGCSTAGNAWNPATNTCVAASQGATGPAGAAATISVGTVTTGAAGTSAVVTNSGTAAAAVLNFTIPQGATGTPTLVWSCQPAAPGDGVNAIPAGSYPLKICTNDTGQTITITGISCYSDTGSSTMNVANNAGTSLLTGAITCSSSYAAGTQSATVTLAAGDALNFTFVADGTTTRATFDVSGTHP